MFCIKCGTKLESDANFCIECGNKVGLIQDDTKLNHTKYNSDILDFDKLDEEKKDKESNDMKVFNTIGGVILFIVLIGFGLYRIGGDIYSEIDMTGDEIYLWARTMVEPYLSYLPGIIWGLIIGSVLYHVVAALKKYTKH